MNIDNELDRLALLSETDDLIRRLEKWIEECPQWESAQKCRLLVDRVLTRVRDLRVRVESPLVIATYGGTGTGKSSLVNALVGAEISESGRQRPTTHTPVLLLHPDIDPSVLGLDLSQFTVKQIDRPVLRDFVLIDCPDPDTSETAAADSNLQILRSIVPQCDVLLYTSTQQKYRSARVSDELGSASEGCRLVFVQTHAGTDSDIRDDWRQQLSQSYHVSDMFFVDSVEAFRIQEEGRQVTGEFRRLQDYLAEQLGTSRRIEIRRSNLTDLMQETLLRCRTEYDDSLPAVRSLIDVLSEQRKQFQTVLSSQLSEELLQNRNLWERRLLGEVTARWGFSPFSALLRFYNGLGGFIASLTFFRARTSAQMALIGAIQGTRWIKARTEEQGAESSLDRLSSFGLSDQQLQESRVAVSGYVREAGIEIDEDQNRRDLKQLRRHAAVMEGEFLGDAGRVIDKLIQELADRNSRWWSRAIYELLFVSYIVLLLSRIGYNFFWSSFLAPVLGQAEKPEELLSVDFYVPAILFLVIWSVVLVMTFTAKLRKGLKQRIRRVAEHMADSHLAHGLFPSLDQTTDAILADDQQLSMLLDRVDTLRNQLANSDSRLGRRKSTPSTENQHKMQ